MKNEIKKVDVESMNKESRIVLFLCEIKNKNKVEIKDLYLNKYKLNEKSNDVNLRVIERFMGVYSKYNDEKKKERVKVVSESLKKSKINYSDLLERMKEVKEKVKRSNKINNIVDLKEIENMI